jgi:hypothetical protein
VRLRNAGIGLSTPPLGLTTPCREGRNALTSTACHDFGLSTTLQIDLYLRPSSVYLQTDAAAMPFSHPSLTIRVSGIPITATRDLLEQRALGYCNVDDDFSDKIKSLFKSSSPGRSLPPIVSLAPQGDSQIGTITFPTEKSKKRALSSLNLTAWRSDDVFNGLTVLYTAPEPDLEFDSNCP